MGDDLKQILGQNIRKNRLKENWTLEQLAEKADISASFLASVERGERALGIGNLIKFSRIFDVTLDYLLYDNITENTRINMLIQLTKTFNDREFDLLLDIIKDVKNLKNSTEA